MKLEKLPKLASKKSKRIGRGPGSGKGKTSGRGTKGQNARGKLSLTHSHFEGGQRSIIKRIPYRRGKGNSKVSKKPLIVNLKALNLLAKNQIINIETLIKAGIVNKADALTYGVKILGNGELNIALSIDMPISKSATKKVIKAGGKITSAQKQ